MQQQSSSQNSTHGADSNGAAAAVCVPWQLLGEGLTSH